MNIASVNNNASFKGAVNPASAGKSIKSVYNNFLEWGAKKVVSPVVNSDSMSKFADKTASIKNMPIHLSTLGAAATSAFYVKSTLQNEKLAKKERKTLALNQALVFGVSTAGAYTVNKSLGKIIDNIKYKFIEYNQGNKHLGDRINGFKVASGLLVFAMMYRYISPVVVTPVASWISKKVGEHKAAKEAQANQDNKVA